MCSFAITLGARACFELAMYEEAVTWCNDGLAVSFYLQKQIGHSGFQIDISLTLAWAISFVSNGVIIFEL